jgi:uncharacterized delta-60 repeat protein
MRDPGIHGNAESARAASGTVPVRLLVATLSALLLMAAGCGSSKPATADGGKAGTGGGGKTGTAGTGPAGAEGGAGTGAAGTMGDGGAPDLPPSNDDGGGDALPAQLGPLAVVVSPTGHDRFYGVTHDAQGNIYAVGQVASSTDTNADIATVVARFSASGVLDTTFGGQGFAVRNLVNGTSGELCRSIVVQSTGKVVVACTVEHPALADAGATDPRDRDIAVARFNADGSKDTTFGTDGVVTLDLSTGVVNGTAFSADSAWGLARYADDRLVVSGGQVRTGGLDTDFALIRLTKDGVRDATFGANGVFTLDTLVNAASNNASPRNVTILPGTDGVIGAGYQPVPGADTKPVVFKVGDTGVLDTTFGTQGVFSQSLLADQTETYEVAVQPIAAGGYNLVTTGYGKQSATETTDLVSLRLSSAGVLDTTWGTNGLVRIDVGGFGDNSRRLVVLPDRRVMLVGGGRATSANVDGLVALLTADGQPDKTFSSSGWKLYDLGGPADFLWSVSLAPDKKTLALAGIKGVGATPTPATANDDASLLILPVPQ